MLPLEHFEGLQVQKYEAVQNSSNGQPQFYRPHLDSISGPEKRTATFIYFLSDVEEGGETFFPLVPVTFDGNLAAGKGGNGREIASSASKFAGRELVFDHHTALAKGMDRWEALCAAPRGQENFLKVHCGAVDSPVLNFPHGGGCIPSFCEYNVFHR